MSNYDWKNEHNPVRRMAKRLLSGDPLKDGTLPLKRPSPTNR